MDSASRSMPSKLTSEGCEQVASAIDIRREISRVEHSAACVAAYGRPAGSPEGTSQPGRDPARGPGKEIKKDI